MTTNVMKEKEVKEHIPFLEKIGYSVGDLGFGFLMNMIGPYLMLFYTDIFGLNPVAVSTMFSVSTLIATLANPSIGVMIDKTNTKWGKCRPILLVGGFITAIFSILCFTAPQLPTGAKIAYAFVCYTGMNIFKCVFQNAYGALVSNLTQSPKLRGSLSLWRMIGSMAGGTFIALIIPKVLNFFEFAGTANSYTFTMLVFAISSCFIFAFTTLTTKERYIETPVENHTSDKKEKVKFKDSFIIMFKNKPLLIYCAFLFLNTGVGVASGSTLSYYFKYILNDMNTFAVINGLKSSVMLGGLLVAPLIIAKVDKKVMMIVSMLGQLVLPAVYCFADSSMVNLVFIATMISSAFSSLSAGLMWALVADTVEYGELHLGKRTEGINFSMANFASCAGSTLCTFIPGIVMSVTGYQSTATVQTSAALSGIRFCNGLLPLIMYVLCAVALIVYPLTNKKCNEVVEELKKKKEMETQGE